MENIIDKYIEQKYIIEKYGQDIIGLRADIERLKSENNTLQEEKDRIVNQPYYIQAFSFREKMKKSFLYGFFKGVRYIYRRLKFGKIVNTWDKADSLVGDVRNAFEIQETGQQRDSCFKEFNYDNLLGAYEYRFLKYKSKRNKSFRIDINHIGVPYKKDLVSVVLPVYNGDDYVDIAIESVLMQTYTNFELIIIDDGSTDRTSEIVDNYALADARVKVIHQENRKLPRTLSRGFRQARGEFFTWTSADNVMHPKFIEKFVDEMKQHPRTGMLFGNIELIDEKGYPKTDFDWYTIVEEHPSHVIFPKCVLELNTFANNYIGAAFMYRSTTACVVEDYSMYKYGIEDYDYWMKINELFDLRHTTFEEIEYSYRLHSKSLTSKDKELKITENRYKQMLLDDFRRNYFLKKQTWIIEGDEGELYKRFVECIKKAGHKIITLEDAKKQTTNLYERYIYVKFTDKYTPCLQDIPENAFKVIVTNKCKITERDACWDTYISCNEVDEKDFISAYNGWYYINNSENLLAFLDSKAKNAFLYELEKDGVSAKFEKRFSIIIPFSNHLEQLLNHNELTDNDEVIVMGGIEDSIVVQGKISDRVRTIVCNTNSVVIRKNIAARMAKGRYLVFLERGCQLLQGSLEGFEEAFCVNKNVATVFGNVEIESIKSHQQHDKELGKYVVESDDIYNYDENNIPSPYCFAVRTKYFKLAGGFYNFEEINVHAGGSEEHFGLAMMLQKYGYYIFLAKDCHVLRKVKDLTLKQVKEFLYNKMLSRYLFQIETVIPFSTWPEGLQKELNDLAALTDRIDIWNTAKADCIKELLAIVRNDFREKEKIDLNRDIFVRPM